MRWLTVWSVDQLNIRAGPALQCAQFLSACRSGWSRSDTTRAKSFTGAGSTAISSADRQGAVEAPGSHEAQCYQTLNDNRAFQSWRPGTNHGTAEFCTRLEVRVSGCAYSGAGRVQMNLLDRRILVAPDRNQRTWGELLCLCFGEVCELWVLCTAYGPGAWPKG